MIMFSYSKVNNNIENLRLSKGLNKKVFKQITGYYCRHSNQIVRLRTVINICNIYNVSFDELVK